jgi:hypothetical protein
MGDTFSNISNSTIVNRSVVQGAINNLRARDQTDTAELLEKLTILVAQSGNREAGELLEGFSSELEKPEPRKGILKTLWAGIQGALPSVNQMLGIAEGIEKLVN